MVISFEFRMGQYGDDDQREYVPHFITNLSAWQMSYFAVGVDTVLVVLELFLDYISFDVESSADRILY